jgi:hypothetical protein
MKLKLKEEHQLRLSKLLKAFGVEKLNSYAHKYQANEFVRSEKCKDKKMRFCFDMFSIIIYGQSELLHEIYKYANDENIYSFLKRELQPQISIINQKK